MSILVGRDTRLLVQGITGREGRFHTRLMLEYGTQVVAGATPGRGGMEVEGLPVFNTVEEAVQVTSPNASIVFVPAPFAPDAIYEAVEAGLKLIVCITEGIPALDMIPLYEHLRRNGVRLVGPNCPGIITPGEAKVGIMPGPIHRPGKVGVVSRSGTLTYEMVNELSQRGLGQSTCIGIGGDPLIGTGFVEMLRLFQADPATDQAVLIGEIGGQEEEQAAEYIAGEMTKPVTAFIAGRSAPPGRRMGHAGAIISGGSGTARAKVAALEAAGARVARSPTEVAQLVTEARRA